MAMTEKCRQTQDFTVRTHMNAILIRPANNMVICDSNRIDTSTRGLKDMFALKGSHVPNL